MKNCLVQCRQGISSCSLTKNSYICLHDPGSWSIPLDSILEHLKGLSLGIEVSTFVSTKVPTFVSIEVLSSE